MKKKEKVYSSLQNDVMREWKACRNDSILVHILNTSQKGSYYRKNFADARSCTHEALTQIQLFQKWFITIWLNRISAGRTVLKISSSFYLTLTHKHISFITMLSLNYVFGKLKLLNRLRYIKKGERKIVFCATIKRKINNI